MSEPRSGREGCPVDLQVSEPRSGREGYPVDLQVSEPTKALGGLACKFQIEALGKFINQVNFIMALKIPGLVIFILVAFGLTAQDKATYRIEYICETNLIKKNRYDGLNTLYFSEGRSLFIHNDFPKETQFLGSFRDSRYPPGIIKGDREGLPVYMDFNLDTMIYKTDYFILSNQNFILSTEIPKIEWVIHDLQREVAGFQTRLAVGEFGGRIYEAWFTEEIPVPFGPYKLNGLPGLILEAFSRDERVSYYFKSFQKIDGRGVKIGPPIDGREMTMEQLQEYLITDLYRAESVGATHDDPHPNWTIEKSKWTIFGDYKKIRTTRREPIKLSR
ncbi:MAG: GLPGLI family protein [Saprospirales bacterium]|nr:MAG: GLPGLI family protein [Saprospirales bacterium]